MPDQVERDPERLSCEWHARECEQEARDELSWDQARESGTPSSPIAVSEAEACFDRAQKLRRLEALEAEVAVARRLLRGMEPRADHLDEHGNGEWRVHRIVSEEWCQMRHDLLSSPKEAPDGE